MITPPRSSSKVLASWLGLALAGALIVTSPAVAAAKVRPPEGVAASSATGGSPAQQLFDQVNDLVQNEYGGLSTVDRVALKQEYQQRLNAVCAELLATCAADKAYPVIGAEVTALKDEHSYFMSPDDFEDFAARAIGGDRRQFGVKLALLDGETRLVLEVVPQSAAEQAGLKRGDVLQTIDSKPYKYDDLRQARVDGRTIQLGLVRSGQALTLPITARESSTRDLPRLSFVGPQNDVALLRIPTFLSGNGVAQTVHDLVGQAKARGARGLLVDLRGDGGGSLTECDNSVSAFVPEFTRIARTGDGDVRTTVSRGSRLEDGRIRGSVKQPQLWTGPMAVLVDEASASCSEFFAYEIQYSGRGPVIGEQTAGVGNTATRVFSLPGDTALQLTITNYVKPDGTPYPVRVTPDQVHAQSDDDLRRLSQGEDTLLNFGLQALSAAPSLAVDPSRN